jgi:hypothetical protein
VDYVKSWLVVVRHTLLIFWTMLRNDDARMTAHPANTMVQSNQVIRSFIATTYESRGKRPIGDLHPAKRDGSIPRVGSDGQEHEMAAQIQEDSDEVECL